MLNSDLAFDGSRDRARCGIGTTGNLSIGKRSMGLAILSESSLSVFFKD
ncbi:hypothetical protein LEP1GSC103_0589 [Leptospira borgpetersenii serovar Javanica str. UI 09931]|uniref:Uncharacterized protein n=4 Tax=Leptospira borgpetersenii TaxID=174 RepID=M3HSS5_LEPBO|nr:hypothetical protein [Leptospira borgpetersenii]EKP11577.1 hypothetical protein LEP1GSC128_1256 [Leptospira borgpetersenii str. 200801926]EKQ93469.1 hypothetical protein LEP1GSC101_0515 [Leptospira borgpetersenii str. UI 09149]EMG01106.1 hypothetical protein LEP1GSC123_1035 [Leptospira borgpetersenii str. 200701203]EMK13776.1 hypothetical protein LEP1GSC066_0768 [Leptospira sp. serovar Kenya str. Sh9]EMN15906.1 hypothetical protein LEP1GSC056_3748 [Leptospira borgpetersenii str. Brem 328]E